MHRSERSCRFDSVSQGWSLQYVLGGSGGVSRSSGTSCCHAVFLVAALKGTHGLSFSAEHGVQAFVSLAERGDARKQLADTLQWHRGRPC